MPCRPAEDDPSLFSECCETARLLIWACEQLERDPPIWVFDLAKDRWTNDPRATQTLCELMRHLNPTQSQLLLAGKVSDSVRLINWWKKHQQWDAERIKKDGN